jgi:hypothetical protein
MNAAKAKTIMLGILLFGGGLWLFVMAPALTIGLVIVAACITIFKSRKKAKQADKAIL